MTGENDIFPGKFNVWWLVCVPPGLALINVHLHRLVLWQRAVVSVSYGRDLHIQGVSGGIVNILGGGSMDYSE
jgi:hypothetical protein